MSELVPQSIAETDVAPHSNLKSQQCKNCSNPLEADDSFCSKCGAKMVTERLTFKHFSEEFSERFLNVDNTFFKTFLHLFIKPDKVIGAYLNGVRKKYLPAVSYFTIALTLSGFQIFIIKRFFPEALDISVILQENNPIDVSSVEWIYDYFSLLTLLTLPLYAVLSHLTFYTLKKYNYVEQLTIMTYVFSHYSITSILITLPSIIFFGANFYIMGYFFMALLMLYTAYCYKKLYPLTLKGIFLRTLLFMAFLFVVLIIYSVIILIILIATGGMNEMIEAEKARQGISYMASSVMNWTS